jgi:hypothetical protein
MFVTGPNVVKTVTHEEVDSEFLGGARPTRRSGVAHLAAPDEAAGTRLRSRRLLAHLPQNNLDRPPMVTASDPSDRMDPTLDTVVPDDPHKPYDMHDVIRRCRRRRLVPRDPARLGAEHDHRVRTTRRAPGRDRRAAAASPRGSARHRRLRSRRRASSAPATASMSLSSRSSTSPASCPESTRSTAGSSSTARNCSTRTARRRSRR